MTGFEPQSSGIGSDHSTNWATTTASDRVSYKLNWNTGIEALRKYWGKMTH